MVVGKVNRCEDARLLGNVGPFGCVGAVENPKVVVEVCEKVEAEPAAG